MRLHKLNGSQAGRGSKEKRKARAIVSDACLLAGVYATNRQRPSPATQAVVASVGTHDDGRTSIDHLV